MPWNKISLKSIHKTKSMQICSTMPLTLWNSTKLWTFTTIIKFLTAQMTKILTKGVEKENRPFLKAKEAKIVEIDLKAIVIKRVEG